MKLSFSHRQNNLVTDVKADFSIIYRKLPHSGIYLPKTTKADCTLLKLKKKYIYFLICSCLQYLRTLISDISLGWGLLICNIN